MHRVLPVSATWGVQFGGAHHAHNAGSGPQRLCLRPGLTVVKTLDANPGPCFLKAVMSLEGHPHLLSPAETLYLGRSLVI